MTIASSPRPPAPPLPAGPPRHARAARPALAAILLVSGALNLYALNTEGYGNTYYAAAVRSMLTNWHNFFYASFDAGGFVSVDKPPLGLWVQAAFAKVLGFHGLSLLLPQALAGVACVALIYLLVQRSFGTAAGLFAAAALAVTPISVVTDRNNTMDALLVLTLLLAAWAVTRAGATGRLRWLLLCAILVGLGFNIKMLQAYLVVPGFALVYLLGAPLRVRTRLWHLALAGLVLLAVSLSWAAAVDLTPAGSRPYVGSSGANSELSLILGYNGLGRLTEAILPARIFHILTIPVDLDVAPAFAPGIGDPGPLRLFRVGLAGQASWLLLPATFGLLVAAAGIRPRLPLDREGQALVLWGGWLVVAGGYFSTARFYHLYYLTMLAPPVAALVGIGFAALWSAYKQGGWERALLPGALAGAALVQLHILSPYPAWSYRLAPVVGGVCFGAAAVLLGARAAPRAIRLVAAAAAVAGVTALLAAPLVWSAVSVRDGDGGAWLPQAGPSPSVALPRGGPAPGRAQRITSPGRTGPPAGVAPQPGGFGPAGGAGLGAMTFAGPDWDVIDPALVRYLEANAGDARYLLATPTSAYASIVILATGRPALALGGYQGWDRIVTPSQLAAMVVAGDVRFFLVPPVRAQPTGRGRPVAAGPDQTNDDLFQWLASTCAPVPAAAWQGASSAGPARPPAGLRAPGADGTGGSLGVARPGGAGLIGGQQLYDCGSLRGPAPAT